MSQRMEPEQFDDGRASHGVVACLDAATGRTRIKSGGERLAHKLRMPASQRWIARIAKRERDSVVAEVFQRLDGKPLSAWHWHSVDRVYFATCGILRGYTCLERVDYVRVNREARALEFHPVVEAIGRLQRMKTEALRDLGLDKPAEPIDVWASIRNAQAAAAASDAEDGQEGDQGPEDATDAKPANGEGDRGD